MSIRRYLVLTLFSMLTLITFIAAIQGYKKSMSHAEREFDQQLLDFAHTLTAINSASRTLSKADNNQSIEVTQQSGFAFQVWKGGDLQFKSENAPDEIISNGKITNQTGINFFEVNFSKQRWRSVSIAKKIPKSNTSTIQVIVAQPLQAQFALAQTLVLAAVTPILLAIVFLSILIFVVITQGLKPLRQLSHELSLRKSNDFTPIEIEVQHNELSDIVATLNNLFARLDASFQRERHFASDAAHELKTPLSVLKIDTHNLIHDLVERSFSSENCPLLESEIENFSSIRSLNNSVDRMEHVIDQILNLNRTNPAQIQSASSRFNLNVLLKQVISELYGSISKKAQTITLESDDCFLTAHEFSIHLLAVNLISNANKYTPIGGEIIVSAKDSTNRGIVLCIEDSGTGIDPKEYKRVFDRFYRIGGDQHSSTTFGCGLGLSIVKHIAELHGAKVSLSKSTRINGLKIEVFFPIFDKKNGVSSV